jgi:hypothetical protein
MEYIKDKSGTIILAFDGDNIYYHFQEPDDDPEPEPDQSISIEHLRLENNGGLKLFTILDLLEELDIITDKNDILRKVKKNIPYLAHLIKEHEAIISAINDRIVLMKMEGSGPASSWIDYLYILYGNSSFDLCSSRMGYLSASEIIDYYGLEENEYWDQIQANGEFIEENILEIKTVNELQDGIISILTNEEKWNMKEAEIDWREIVDVLIHNMATHKLGIELKSMINTD